MLLGWGTVGLAYALGGCVAWLGFRASWLLPQTPLDMWITPTSSGVYVYLSLFFLVPYTFFKIAPARLIGLQHRLQVCAVVSCFVFLIFPSTMQYAAIEGSELSHKIHRALIHLDSAHNCLPSLHGVLLVLCVLALWQVQRPWRSGLMLAYGLAQCIAIVQLRRHGAIDLSAGLLLGFAVHLIFNRVEIISMKGS
jgi:membrane-associated phospholipid phosphatase